ncbi:MAG: hypothetical protein RIR96_1021 [Bacteroidota bacterium]
MRKSMDYSERIELLYQIFKDQLLQEKDDERRWLKMQDFIHFCWMNAPLRFSDPELEALIMQKRPNWNNDVIFSNDQRRFVYLASTLFEVGGHTRCLMNTISHLPEQEHTVILTRQYKNIPPAVSDFFTTHNVKVICLDKLDGLMKKVETIRKHILEIKPAKVFSFHHPDDLIPVLSITGSRSFQSVLYNHADHVYSLGAHLFDKHIDFRKTGARISSLGKNVKAVNVVPLPLLKKETIMNASISEKWEQYDYVVGTLTNISKVKPYQNTETILEVMMNLAHQYKNLLFLIIGIDTDTTEKSVGKKVPCNLKCLGVVPNPDAYYQKLDFFLEPFPVGSGLGILEACQYGAIPLFGKHPVRLCSTFEVFHEEIQKMFDPELVILKQEEQLQIHISKPKSDWHEYKEKFRSLIQEYHNGVTWKNSFLNDGGSILDSKTSEGNQDWLKEEALFFQTYMEKNDKQLLSHLLGLKKLVNRKILLKLLFSSKLQFSIQSALSENRGRFIHRLVKG